MKTKLISLMLAASVALSSFPTCVSAADVPLGEENIEIEPDIISDVQSSDTMEGNSHTEIAIGGDTGTPMIINSAGDNVEGFLAPIDNPDANAVKISTAEELASIGNNLNGSYVLTKDIDLSTYGEWSPISTSLSSAFHGKLDGQGHKIIGLKVPETFTSGTIVGSSFVAGLFGVLSGAQIKNIQFENADVSIKGSSGYDYSSAIDSDQGIYAGIIAGYANNSTTIFNCFTTGSVSARILGEGHSPIYAGGLLGAADTVLVSYSYNLAKVQGYYGNTYTSSSDICVYSGGVAGRITTEGIIDRSYNSGAIVSQFLDFGNSYGGGIIGGSRGTSVKITDCFNEGKVQGLTGNAFCDGIAYAGGIAADFSGTIDKVYNSGEVQAKASDPYKIEHTTAYAGGICGISSQSAEITNSVSVQWLVAADASGQKYQYRISYQGQKSNNITSDEVAQGSQNDADIVKTVEEMKSEESYTSILGWDFTNIWEMVPGKDFPRLKQVDVENEEYDEEYIEQHLQFIAGSTYADILENHRWAQIYWSEENNFKSNLAGALYSAVDWTVDWTSSLLDLDLKSLFKGNDPFPVMVADYIADQSAVQEYVSLYKAEVPFSADKIYGKAKKFISDNWKDAYGELSDEDLFYLFHYDKKPSGEWINENFEKHLPEIVCGDKTNGFEKVLGIQSESLNEILDVIGVYNIGVEYINGLLEYAVCLDAYRSADEDFKIVLKKMTENFPQKDYPRYGNKLKKALEDYTTYDESEDNIIEFEVSNYLDRIWLDLALDFVSSNLNKKKNNWLNSLVQNGGMSADTLNAYKIVTKAAKATWGVMEYATKNGDLQACREMLRANAFFEDTVYNTMKQIETDFVGSNTLENACLFDAAFKFLKNTEAASMDTVIQYLDTYKVSWIAAIRRHNAYMDSAIEEVHINKLLLSNTYCHGTSYQLGGKIITIACPTDVYIYDENNNLVSAIENDVITKYSENIFAYTANAVKLVFVPADQDYKVEIHATEDGTMSYSISEYNAEFNNIRTTVYSDIEINEGDTFEGTVGAEIGIDPATYTLRGPEGYIDVEPKNATNENNISVESISIRTESSDHILHIGDSVQQEAVIEPEKATNQSVVWTSSDDTVLSVTENGIVKAKSAGEATITVQSLYGGVSASVSYTVEADKGPETEEPGGNQGSGESGDNGNQGGGGSQSGDSGNQSGGSQSGDSGNQGGGGNQSGDSGNQGAGSGGTGGVMPTPIPTNTPAPAPTSTPTQTPTDTPTPTVPEAGKLILDSAQAKELADCTTGSKDCVLKLTSESGEELTDWTYESLDERVVEVMKTGVFHFTGVGETVVKVAAKGKDSGKTYALEIKVKVKKPGRPTFTPSNISRKKKTFTVTSSTVRGANGFQVRYSLKNLKKTTKGSKKVSFETGKKMIRKTVKTNKSRRKYYVQVRAYQIINGKRVYSAWSSVKSIKSR